MDDSKDIGGDPSIHSEDTNQQDDLEYKQDVEKQHIDNKVEDGAAADAEAHKDLNVVGWDGPDDPANPMNWPKVKKVGAIAVVSFITLLS